MDTETDRQRYHGNQDKQKNLFHMILFLLFQKKKTAWLQAGFISTSREEIHFDVIKARGPGIGIMQSKIRGIASITPG